MLLLIVLVIILIGTRINTFAQSIDVSLSWLSVNMENIEQGRPIEFIRHRRESGGYEKHTSEHLLIMVGEIGTYTRTEIKRVDNRTEID